MLEEQRRRRKRKRLQEDVPIAEEVMGDLCEKYPFIKKMLQTFELEVS